MVGEHRFRAERLGNGAEHNGRPDHRKDAIALHMISVGHGMIAKSVRGRKAQPYSPG